MVYEEKKTVKEFLLTLKKGTQITIGSWVSEAKFAIKHAPIEKINCIKTTLEE